MKDNNKPVNDIFQNDSGSKNKTKTILLLTIVAIVLISVFLIIIWVMTRDNPSPFQEVQNKNASNTVVNETKPRTMPYSHGNNANDTRVENPLGLNINSDSMDKQPSLNPIDIGMSQNPPMTVPNNVAQEPAKNGGFEDDVRYQQAIKDIQKQHATKETESIKQNEPKETPKVIIPPKPVETTIATAPDPTKPTQKPKEPVKPDNKTQDSSNKAQEPAKPSPQPTPTKPKEPEKTPEKPVDKKPDNIIPKPKSNVMDANQGKTPEKGYYLQVGVFTQTPAQSFLNKISKYNYRVLKTEEDGVAKSKYLIGPYISKNKAKEAEQKVREEVESKATVIFYERTAK